MNAVGRPDGTAGEHGFALLVMLAIVGIGSVGILLAVQGFLAPLAETNARVEANLGTVERAAREAFVRDGAFPADLDALATTAGLPVDGGWRLDPWGSALDLDYQRSSASLQVRSRGNDRSLGTSDDHTVAVAAEPLLRLRQRGHLRLLRALFLRSPYRFAVTMSTGELASMRTAMHDYAVARRRWWGADAALRVTLTAQMAAAALTVTTLATTHACVALPAALTGAGGLMEQLGVADGLAIDGLGRALLADPVLGVVAAGNDLVGGTDDDM